MCPTCNTRLEWDQLFVDGYFLDILDSVGPDTEKITIESNGTWRIADEEIIPMKFNNSKNTSNHDSKFSSNLNVLGLSPSPPSLKRKRDSDWIERESKDLLQEDSVIVLGEEDDSDSLNLKTSLLSRPFHSSRSLSGSPGSLSRIFQAPGVIDLTLSDDDDDNDEYGNDDGDGGKEKEEGSIQICGNSLTSNDRERIDQETAQPESGPMTRINENREMGTPNLESMTLPIPLNTNDDRDETDPRLSSPNSYSSLSHGLDPLMSLLDKLDQLEQSGVSSTSLPNLPSTLPHPPLLPPLMAHSTSSPCTSPLQSQSLSNLRAPLFNTFSSPVLVPVTISSLLPSIFSFTSSTSSLPPAINSLPPPSIPSLPPSTSSIPSSGSSLPPLNSSSPNPTFPIPSSSSSLPPLISSLSTSIPFIPSVSASSPSLPSLISSLPTSIPSLPSSSPSLPSLNSFLPPLTSLLPPLISSLPPSLSSPLPSNPSLPLLLSSIALPPNPTSLLKLPLPQPFQREFTSSTPTLRFSP